MRARSAAASCSGGIPAWAAEIGMAPATTGPPQVVAPAATGPMGKPRGVVDGIDLRERTSAALLPRSLSRSLQCRPAQDRTA